MLYSLNMLNLDDFLSYIDVSPVTKRDYRLDLLGYQAFIGETEPTQQNARAYIVKLRQEGKKPPTIARRGQAIRRYFDWSDIPLKLELPKIQLTRDPKYMLDTQIAKLLAVAETPLEEVLIKLLYESGMRIGEFLGIETGNINWEKGTIKFIRKGAREAEVGINKGTLKALRVYMQWAKHSGKKVFPYTYWELRHWWHGMLERTALPKVGFHVLRHSRAANLRIAGQKIEDISDLLGHTSLTTTEKIYGKIEPEVLREIIQRPFWEE